MTSTTLPNIADLMPRIPLWQSLGASSEFLFSHETTSVSVLRLSMRSAKSLTINGISTINQLLSLTIKDMYDAPAMGPVSIEEIVHNLYHFIHIRGRIYGNNDKICTYLKRDSAYKYLVQSTKFSSERTALAALIFSKLRLQDEWDTFACGAPARLDIRTLPLPPQLLRLLTGAEGDDRAQFLSLTLEEVQEALGEQGVEVLLISLVTAAAEQRAVPASSMKSASRKTDAPDFDGKRRLLEARWSHTPITRCGFETRTNQVLRVAGIVRLGDLLGALEPLSSCMCFDLPVFCDVWERLVSLELRQGDAYSEWVRLVTASGAARLDDVVQAVQNDCTVRQWLVLSARFGLDDNATVKPAVNVSRSSTQPLAIRSGPYRTLEEVGAQVGLTRERVRQIEASACNKLQRLETSVLSCTTATLRRLVEQAGGIVSVSQAVQQLTAYFPAQAVNAYGVCFLLMEASEQFVSIERGSVYRLASIPSAHHKQVIEYALDVCAKSDVRLTVEELARSVEESLKAEGLVFMSGFVRECLELDKRFTADFNRRDLSLLLRATLRQIGKPAYYSDIAALFRASHQQSAQYSEEAIHSRLAQNRDLFACVARGVYGLVEWGSKDRRGRKGDKKGFIGNHIEAFLTERAAPIPIAQIVAYVKTKKPCAETSIQTCLQTDDRFCSVRYGFYGLKTWTE